DLAPRATLLPHEHRLVRAEPREERADRVPVADDDAVDAAHLAGLRRDAQAARRAHEGERRLGSRARDLERGRASRLGERAVREERAAPGGLGLLDTARDDLRRQPTDGPAALVEQTRLAGEGLAVAHDAHDVP